MNTYVLGVKVGGCSCDHLRVGCEGVEGVVVNTYVLGVKVGGCSCEHLRVGSEGVEGVVVGKNSLLLFSQLMKIIQDHHADQTGQDAILVL